MRIQVRARSVTNLLLAGIAAAHLPIQAADPSIFKVAPTPNDNPNNGLYAVSASSPSDIWAVGQSTIHFDGTKWTAFEAPMIVGDNNGSLEGVADISSTEAWAAGNASATLLGQPAPVIEHWDGTQWNAIPASSFNAPGESASLFLAMTAISANDIWALGGGTLNGNGGTLFEHWDGEAWTPNIVFLGGLPVAASADATDDVWAVGFSGVSAIDGAPFVAHYDGTAWQNVPGPKTGIFNAVAALAPNDVWAVGSMVKVKNGPTRTLIEHYDGSQWSVSPSPNVGPNSMFQSNRLLGITAVSRTDIWAFGSYFAADGSGQQKTLLLHWDGTSWNLAASPSPDPGSFQDDVLFGGVVTAPGGVWIVGSEDTAAPNKPFTSTLVLHTTGG
jgi:hypothetical protein